jgi:hypothetical protein
VDHGFDMNVHEEEIFTIGLRTNIGHQIQEKNMCHKRKSMLARTTADHVSKDHVRQELMKSQTPEGNHDR